MRRKTIISALLLSAACGFPMLHGGVIGVLLTEDFSNPAIHGSVGGGLVATHLDAQIGAGPYRGEVNGVLGLVDRPTAEIGTFPEGSEARITQIVSTTVLLNLESNFGRVYDPNIGFNYGAGLHYIFEADFRSNSLLTAQLLTNAGFGIELLADGTQIARTSPDVSTVNIVLFGDEMSGRITLEYTAAAGDDGKFIGVGGFVGSDAGGLLQAHALDLVAFTDLTVTAIPEPSTYAAMFGGLALLVVIGRRWRAGRLRREG